MNLRKLTTLSTALLLLTTGCGDDEGPGDGTETPEVYEFSSRFEDGSSVSYSGQTLRHVLIDDLATYISELHDDIEASSDFDPSGVEENLLSYYEFDSDILGGNAILLETDPSAKQGSYDDISSGKNLTEKVAGQDSGGAKDHKDWSTEFVGWSDESVAENGGDISNPDGLLRAFFKTIAKNAEDQVNGARGDLKTHQTASGQDLHQLVQKFLLGALTFSQGADDYLDEGLTADNSESDEGAAYTALEHAWDEGFGYFGASRDYLLQSDADIADGLVLDSDEDGQTDLTFEYNFGASVNAAKRDLGSQSGTDFTSQAASAFLEGRALISAEGSLEEIEEQAELAVDAWEKALSSTAVHYINDTLGDMAALGSDDYSFDDHSKHWSELKGFALGLQFNPRSPLSDEDFEKLHSLIGDAPVLGDASEEALEEYESDLLLARSLLGEGYGFEADDLENW